eukprot:scaffold208925_cov17-Tisochrysis_lutea.AAC.1
MLYACCHSCKYAAHPSASVPTWALSWPLPTLLALTPLRLQQHGATLALSLTAAYVAYASILHALCPFLLPLCRHGATSVGEFANQGYLAPAMINFLSLLGWNDGTEQEIYQWHDRRLHNGGWDVHTEAFKSRQKRK